MRHGDLQLRSGNGVASKPSWALLWARIGFTGKNPPIFIILEQATPDIRQEALNVMQYDSGFEPYLQYPDTAPLDQWRELNRSLRWSAFHFYHYGRRYEENCARCPKTMASLAQIPQPWVAQRMPAAMFSVLKPKTRIPPHTGVANVRLVVHLPLVVPPGCGFRVGNEVREWRVGQAWVFDDTIEHEAWNESDQVRVILICDVWNPRLSATERELIRTILQAMDEFNGFVQQGAL
jgi:aspartate beta-hydroxylase